MNDFRLNKYQKELLQKCLAGYYLPFSVCMEDARKRREKELSTLLHLENKGLVRMLRSDSFTGKTFKATILGRKYLKKGGLK